MSRTGLLVGRRRAPFLDGAGLVFDRGQKLSFVFDFVTKFWTVSGATSGNGTHDFSGSGWVGPLGTGHTLYVGHAYDFSDPFTGRFVGARIDVL